MTLRPYNLMDAEPEGDYAVIMRIINYFIMPLLVKTRMAPLEPREP